MLLALLGFARGPARSDRVTLTVDRAQVIGISHLQLGVTHTQHSADAWNNPAAVSRARGLLHEAVVYQNQHIMGWGADNPEKSPGQLRLRQPRRARGADARHRGDARDHAVLRARLDEGRAGGLDRLVEARARRPTRRTSATSPQLAAAVAKRYPDVRYFQVWNELKGFWRPALHR